MIGSVIVEDVGIIDARIGVRVAAGERYKLIGSGGAGS